MRLTLCHFIRLRVTISRRSALEHIGDVNIAGTIKCGGFQDCVEQRTGAPHKRLAGSVFLGPGRFADQHPAGRCAACPKDGMLTRAAQRAVATRADPGCEGGPPFVKGSRTYLIERFAGKPGGRRHNWHQGRGFDFAGRWRAGRPGGPYAKRLKRA